MARRLRRTALDGRGVLRDLLVLFAAARAHIPPARCSSFPANEGSTAREAAFRIEPRAPASPAHRRAGLRAERAVGARRERSGGHVASSRLPWTCTGLRRRRSCSSPPPALASRRLGAIGGCVRSCSFESGRG